MKTPFVAFDVWILAVFDPIIILVALYLGGTADQFGKLAIAVIAAVALSLLGGFVITLVGLPWMSPVGGKSPTLVPVRLLAACVWALIGFYGVKLLKRFR